VRPRSELAAGLRGTAVQHERLLPCVAGRHDHERHLRKGEGDGVAVRREDGQAVGPHTRLLHLRGWRQRRLQRRRAHARQQ
jgi:hypothetical protein